MRSPGAAIAVSALALILAALAAIVYRSALRPAAPGGEVTAFRTERMPGLALAVPDLPLVEVAPEPASGRLVVADPKGRLRVLIAWAEAPARGIPREVLGEVQKSWLAAARVNAGGMLTPGPGAEVAGHPAATRVGLEGARHEHALTWYCTDRRRLVHALISGESGAGVPAVAARMAKETVCHAAGGAAAPAAKAAPRTALPVARGWNVVSQSATRCAYAGAAGMLDAVVEEGPAPAGDPVAHVLSQSQLWPPLLTGIVGRQMPVEQPGARLVADLAHGHPAVRVSGRLQPEPTAGAPLAPILFVESTIWVCGTSQRLVSVSAVTPDREVLKRARPVLDGARCH